MKTITEFDGFKLNQALVQFKAIMGSSKPAAGKPTGKLPEPKKLPNEESAAAVVEAAPAAEETPVEASVVAAEAVEASETPETTPASEAAPVEVSKEEKLKTALTEAYKMEGEKLEHFMNALKCIEKKNQFLKRVIVMTLNEGEKAPQGAEKIGETHYFLAEYFPAPAKKGPPAGQPGKGDFKGRGKGRGKGKGKPGQGKGSERGKREAGAGGGAAASERGNRPPRGERKAPALPTPRA